MVKKYVIAFLVILYVLFFKTLPVYALNQELKIEITPMACQGNPCPVEMQDIYNQLNQSKTRQEEWESCAAGNTPAEQYQDFLSEPRFKHFWVEDPQMTAQGKADERAREFIYWVLNKNDVDNHPILRSVWATSSQLAFIFMLVIAALMGMGFFIGQRANFDLNIKIWPTLMKLGLSLLYIAFSALIVLSLIQISEQFMRYFNENLGGKNLFNIYFHVDSASPTGSTEKNYTDFVGCRDLNIRVQEAADSEIFLLKLTNITYYVMGTMLLLRKIILWFLLFVSPFLAIVMPFVFIRNIGWIWIGVFFQWLGYGPLFALFLGALNQMWQAGIPFQFDFSRAGKMIGYIYPTALILTYGGPAQRGEHSIGALNNGSYVDTFAEYIITLIMLWAVIFFPWWLLRIFRDYCCDGIYAMKNILLSMYDQMRNPPPGSPSSPTGPAPANLNTGLKMQTPQQITVPIQVKLETFEEVRKARTEEIPHALNLAMNRLTDIAHFETDKTSHQAIMQNLHNLSNPTQASTPNEKQKFMNIRTELFNRSIKDDRVARQILSATATSTVERMQRREAFLKTTPQSSAVSQLIAQKTNLPQDAIHNVTSAVTQSLSQNQTLVNSVSHTTNIPTQQIQQIFNSYSQNLNQPVQNIVNNIANQTSIPKAKVRQVLQLTHSFITQGSIIRHTAEKEKLNNETVEKVLQNIPTTATQTQTQPIAETIAKQSNITPEKAASVVSNVMNAVANSNNMVNAISTQTSTSAPQVQTVIKTYTQNVYQTSAPLMQQVTNQTGLKQEKVTEVLNNVTQTVISANNSLKEVAQKVGLKETDVEKIMNEQLPLVADTEQNIEKTITLPSTVSIEDYEEVKKMWTQQYEKGEVPTTENITNRDEWIEEDIIFISNTLNKLLSADEKLRQEGLDELEYIIPIFILNNLKGDELLVYLKAKLEAAKATKESLQKEKQIREEVEKEKDKDENLVEVDRSKTQEKAKELHMEMSMDEPTEDNKPTDGDSAESTTSASHTTSNSSSTASTHEEKN